MHRDNNTTDAPQVAQPLFQEPSLRAWIWHFIQSLRSLELGAQEAWLTARIEQPTVAEKLKRFQLGLARAEGFLGELDTTLRGGEQ